MGNSVLGLVLLLVSTAVLAAAPIETHEFANPEQEARYRLLIAEFRCPKCLNTNLSGSDAPIAVDLRRTVFRLLTVENYTDQEIRDYLQARYGDFVLYDPPFKSSTWLLWLAPLVFVLISCFVLWRMLRQGAPEGLSAEESQRLKDILEDG